MKSAIDLALEILEAQVRNVFGDMENKGLVIGAGEIKNTQAIGDYAEVSILNPTTGKILRFWHAPILKDRPAGVSVFLENGAGDSFALDEYLEYNKADSSLSKLLTLANHQGTTAERLSAVLNIARAIIDQHLTGYIYGNEWQHIPIQWGDMK